MIIRTHKENIFYTIQNKLMVKTTNKMGQSRDFINPVKEIYEKYMNLKKQKTKNPKH